MKEKKEKKEEFMKKNFVTCECGYNNEKSRFYGYGLCLKCGKILDTKIYFKAEMRKRLKELKRRRS